MAIEPRMRQAALFIQQPGLAPGSSWTHRLAS
jgi:hypothetical protein